MRANLAAQLDPAILEALYENWKQDPASLDPSWHLFFLGFDLASCPRSCRSNQQANDQSAVTRLINAYRKRGHIKAHINPLAEPAQTDELDLARFGLTDQDLARVFDTGNLTGANRASLEDIIGLLKETYCRSIGVEYLHIQDAQIRSWLQQEMEASRNQSTFTAEQKRTILKQLMDAELLESFIKGRYLGQKQFSLAGGESLIPMLHAMIDQASSLGTQEVVFGMAHRGRLNVLANILQKSYTTIFAEFEDNYLPDAVCGDGDVKYHKGFSSTYEVGEHASVAVSLTANPSHLEAVGPVVMGRCRAKQTARGATGAQQQVLPILIHGDAAFSGQGTVAETFNLSRLQGYQVGGMLHVVVNNQIGFTTPPSQARSSDYATDMAKIVEAPVFHVNGDDPQAVVHVARLATRFRQKFAQDAVIDLVCFRRYGHSEVDEPAFTQPVLYKKIRQHPSVMSLYAKHLTSTGELDASVEHELAQQLEQRLAQAHKQAQASPSQVDPVCYDDEIDEQIETAVPQEQLQQIAQRIHTVPNDFQLHPKIGRLLDKRRSALQDQTKLDWAVAETLAFASLVNQGTPVRLSGQDSERGTFSQRHAVWLDTQNERRYVPIKHIHPDQAAFEVINSPLSEASVLGFEYGYSLSAPTTLVLWEAQFGDFANGAQVLIDQFIVSAQSKWQRASGLVMLLPHGFEGQGPEHSNAYLERFLAACAEGNIQVCNPTTPAQYFHLLRRQARQENRRPLVVMTPKSLLRHPLAVSSLADLSQDRFRSVLIDDPDKLSDCQRLVLCSGKIYYALLEHKTKTQSKACLVRVEQLYPFPRSALSQLAQQTPQAQWVWCQEEPENRGAYRWIEPKLRDVFSSRPVQYVGRPASASPAVGSLHLHRLEQAEIVEQAL